MKKVLAVLVYVILFASSLSVSVYADSVIDEFADYLGEHFERYDTYGIDITGFVDKYGWSKEKTLEMIASTYYSHPEFFFVENALEYATYDNRIVSVRFDYVIPQSKLEYARKLFDAEARKVVEGITSDMSDLDKALYVHDYIILNCRYDTTKTNYSGYNCLVDKLCVCQGYSLAYEYILRYYLGIECTTVYSNSKNHIWNYVKIGKNWYHVDLTLDDVLDTYKNVGYDKYGCVLHDNFMMSDDLCRKTSDMHSNWVVAGDCPAATDKSYDNAFWRDLRCKLCYVGGNYFYASNGGKEKGKRVVNLCRYDPKTQQSNVIMKLKCAWYSRRNSTVTSEYPYGTHSYTDIYASLEYANGRLYINTNKSVYSYNLATKKASKLYTLNKGEEMQIFGMVMISDGKLRVAYKKDLTYAETYLRLVLK
ncbi:MAG: hypothetical protein IK093_19030 [Ruminiclostridium sp.]|nr:hypothetical protein [Ruminiclostridium sp.]